MSEKGSGGFVSLLKGWLVCALGVWLGSYFVSGISYDDKLTLFLAVALLGLFSAILKPLLVLLALPFVILTLGIGILFINALLYLLVGELLSGFTVDGFGAAFWGALFVSLMNLLFSGWISGRRRRVYVNMNRGSGPSRSGGSRRAARAKDDVIDI